MMSQAPTSSSSSSSSSNNQIHQTDKSKQEEEDAESTTSIPNWRVITGNELDAGSDGGSTNSSSNTISARLQQRPAWSQAAFEEARRWYCDELAVCSDTYISRDIQEALRVLNDAYRLYGPQHVICSFNGGKDASVILELIRAAHARYYHDLLQELQQLQSSANNDDGGDDGDSSAPAIAMIRPRVVYWDREGEFPQVLQFVRDMVNRYDLDMICFAKGIGFTKGLELLVTASRSYNSSGGGGGPLAFVLGTRQGDPNAVGQGVWEPSSASFMPPFMRVNPILTWNYGQVWQFLRSSSPQSCPLPVCSLYHEGYTSLGSMSDTVPNPALFLPSQNRYRQAWMLTDYDQERAGRIDTKKKQKTTTTVEPQQANNAAGNSSNHSVATNISTMSKSKPATITTQQPAQDETDQVPATVQQEQQKDRPKPPNSMESDLSVEEDQDSITEQQPQQQQQTVGLLIIGDEILKGYAIDTNSQAAATALMQQGVLLKRIVVVSDDLNVIVKEIHRMQKEVDVCVTSGGIGATHDDITIKSVAAAFGDGLELHPEMVALLRDKMNTPEPEPLSEAQVKMATLPRRSRLRYLDNDNNNAAAAAAGQTEEEQEEPKAKPWPILQYRNVFVLPGVPEYFVPKMEQVAQYLSATSSSSSGGRRRPSSYKVVLSAEETTIVSQLNEVVQRHDDHVTFGSYPFVNQPSRKTVITVEAKSSSSALSSSPTSDNNNNDDNPPKKEEVVDHHVQEALDDLIATLPDDCVVRVDVDDMLLFQ